MGGRESDWKWGESQASNIVPSLIPSLYTASQSDKVGCTTAKYLRLHPLQDNQCANMGVKAALPNTQKHKEAAKLRRRRNIAQVKEQTKTPEKNLSDEEIANLSDAEFKILVIRRLTEMVEYGHKMEEKVKAMQNEMKRNV